MENPLANIRWRLVLQVGLGVVLLSNLLLLLMLVIYVLIFDLLNLARGAGLLTGEEGALVIGRDSLFELSAGFFASVVDWGLPAVTILVTASAAARVARDVEARARLHGGLVGLVAAFGGLLMNASLSVEASEGFYVRAVSVFFLTVAAGLMGSVPIHLEQVRAEALYRASRAIRRADSLQAIVSAIGENLAGPDASAVALWQVQEDGEGRPLSFTLLAAWTARKEQSWPGGMKLEVTGRMPSLAVFPEEGPIVLQMDRMDPAERKIWEQLGIRHALLLPITGGVATGAGGASERGLIMVTSESESAFGEEQLRTYLSVDAQVGLMLENLRLVGRAREAGVFQERQRLAHEIHDTLAQGFTSIVMHMEAAEQALPVEPAQVGHHVAMARQTARDNLAQARRLVWALRPPALERATLPEAVERTVRRWSDASGVGARTVITGTVTSLHPSVEVVLLRAVQEALANVLKHAGARQVTVTLSYADELILLDVQDDGVGFDPAEAGRNGREPESGGYGLPTMAERVQRLGGTLSIESEPGGGTTLAIALPAGGQPETNGIATGAMWNYEI